MAAMFRRVAIVGVGMVGGSLGRACLARGLAETVVGIDPAPGVLEKALELGAVTEAAAFLRDGIAGADLVVLAAPVLASLALLDEIAPFVGQDTLVTDVCSTKGVLLKRAEEALPEYTLFVGGHPMAGSEKEGVGALDEHLFENAVYVLTGEGEALERMVGLVQGLGAVPLVMDAGKHDRLVAAVSHLPHMAASALVRSVAGLEMRAELLALAAGGFRDTTRVAMGSPQMWKDICLTNRENVVELLDRLVDELVSVRELVAAGNADGLLEHFREAREFRLQVPVRGKY